MHIKRMHDMIETLTECAEHEVKKGTEQLDAEEFGKVTDMIKDLAEAEYYASITKAMEESEYGEDYDYEGKRYYNRNRYANGRFAPKGRGMRRGYSEPRYHMTPEEYREHEHAPEYWRDMDFENGRMYYTESGMSSGSTSSVGSRGGSNMDGSSSQSRYDSARRSYTESKQIHSSGSAEDKQENMKLLEKLFGVIEDDISILKPKMTTEEKSLAKQKLTKYANMM